MPTGLFYLSTLDWSISNRRDVCLVFILTMLYKIPISHANSADPDQTSHSVASDLGLHCLSMSFLWNARRKWFCRGFISVGNPRDQMTRCTEFVTIFSSTWI